MKFFTTIPMFLYATLAIGQPDAALAQDESKFTSKDDKSGTNPINFQNDVRFYNEYQDLGNGATGNVTTFEYRTPFAGGKWQYRTSHST